MSETSFGAGQVELTGDDEDAMLVTVDIGAAIVMSRVTRNAVAALSLREGVEVWVLVKAVSTRGHAFRMAAR